MFENLLDHADKLNLTREDIKNKKITFYPNSKRIGLLRFNNVAGFEIYDDIQFAVDTKLTRFTQFLVYLMILIQKRNAQKSRKK